MGEDSGRRLLVRLLKRWPVGSWAGVLHWARAVSRSGCCLGRVSIRTSWNRVLLLAVVSGWGKTESLIAHQFKMKCGLRVRKLGLRSSLNSVNQLKRGKNG